MPTDRPPKGAGSPAGHTRTGIRIGARMSRPLVVWGLAVLAPVLTALVLTLGRGHLSAANDALIFVLVTVAIAASGNRGAAALAALVSAASFDFFLTRPYQSFRIQRSADLTTEVLFVLVGLLVGDLAARGRRYRTAADEGRHGINRLHGVGEQIVEGEDPEFVLINVATQLRELLDLRDCRFVREPPSGKGAWIETDGTVRLNPLKWPVSSVGLPTRQVELPIRGGGEVLGTFILTPTPAQPISHERCVVAVALADQLGAALAAHRDPD
jgi:hypothetical protein